MKRHNTTHQPDEQPSRTEFAEPVTEQAWGNPETDTSESVADLLQNFDLAKAVIYSEILNPKFEEE